MIQLCDFITTTYQVYLDNCFRSLQQTYSNLAQTNKLASARETFNIKPKIFSFFRDPTFGGFYKIEYEFSFFVSLDF